jgi:transposase InsO family protein
VTTPEDRRVVIGQMQQAGLSERAASRWSPWSRRVTLYDAKLIERDAELVEQMKLMSLLYPRFGYRRIAIMLNESIRRVRRLWGRHGFKLGAGRPKRRRSHSNEDERPHHAEHADHVWTYDIIEDRLADGSTFRMLCVLDEFTRECLAIYVARTIRAADVIRVLQAIMDTSGRRPEFIRSDNGGQFAANDVMAWLRQHRVGPAFIDPGCPWQNGFVESFHGKFRDECLNREWFKSIQEATIVIEQWRRFYNAKRPHSSLNYLTPAAFAAAQHAHTSVAEFSTVC